VESVLDDTHFNIEDSFESSPNLTRGAIRRVWMRLQRSPEPDKKVSQLRRRSETLEIPTNGILEGLRPPGSDSPKRRAQISTKLQNKNRAYRFSAGARLCAETES